MKVAVIQHRIRETLEQDIDALAVSIRSVCESSVSVVICPTLPSLTEDQGQARTLLLDQLKGCPVGTTLLIPFREASAGEVTLRPTPLGDTVFLLGDECVTPQVMDFLAANLPEAVVLRPRSESELQAEAFLEHAIGLSMSVAGLVVVAECVGAQIGDPGHGGSAVAMLGEIKAEATDGEETLLIDVEIPISPPGLHEEMPQISPILEQRVAHHEGRKLDVGYLADLS